MSSFISSEDAYLTDEFLRDGYVIAQAESYRNLHYLHGLVRPHEPPVDGLNELKLATMARLNADPEARIAYYGLASGLLSALVGNELAMQKRFNLNVQVPHDEGNLLPIHADTWTGDSPYQVVLWVPFTDCYRTKSLWILPPEHAKDFRVDADAETLFRRIEDKVKYVEVDYGEVLIFNPTLPHGNRVNVEDTTRWTLNCRFKSVWTPYGVKGPGEHFEPITLRAASRIGMAYRHPV